MKSNTVGLRAFRIALAISSAFLLVSTAFLFVFEYRQRSAIIDAEVHILYEAQASGIVEGLWDYDYELLHIMAEGLDFYPYINYVEIRENAGTVVTSGSRKAGSSPRSYELERKAAGRGDAILGTLLIEIDSERIVSDVTGQVLVSVAFQVLFLALESLIVLFLFSRMVTRHLAKIATHIKEFEVRPGAPPLTLDKSNAGDELDILVQSFNAMHENLQASHEAEARAMEELKLSEETNRILVEEAPDAILMYDFDQGRFISCNRRAELLFGRSRDQLVGAKPEDLYEPLQPDGMSSARSVAEATAKAAAGAPVLVRRHVRDPRGGTMICEVRLTRLPSEGRRIIRASFLDITDRVHAEEEVARSLREKEVLLQEVYHRTKNNMQLIASFLSMQADSCDDERVSGILNEMIGRISSMALIHQKLYESKDLSRIDFGEYINDLVQGIQQAFLCDRPEIEILVQAEAGIVSLLDTAIPCALALNELIVNAVKYAFPDGRGGTIRVSFARAGPDTLGFSVSDDGVGLPRGFDLRCDGRIGLQTVVSLIEGQLRGTIAFSSGPGTTCTATIRENVYNARL